MSTKIYNSNNIITSIIIVLCLFGCKSSLDTIDSPLRKIAFESDRGGQQDIYIMNEDGSETFNLTDDQSSNGLIQFTPCGSKIFFGSEGNIFFIDINGENRINLTDSFPHNVHVSRISPDGNMIIFTSYTDEWHIYLLNLENGEIQNLTKNSTFKPSPHALGTNGTEIVYEHHSEGNFDIIMMHLDGTGAINLTEDYPNVAQHPRFSPDGDKIAFHYLGEFLHDIYVVDLIERALIAKIPTFANYPSFNFSPDGSKIVYTFYDFSDGEIYQCNVDGTNPTALTDNTVPEGGPSYSPDGKRIVYVYDHNPYGEIYIMKSDGSSKKNLTKNPAHDYNPLFQP